MPAESPPCRICGGPTQYLRTDWVARGHVVIECRSCASGRIIRIPRGVSIPKESQGESLFGSLVRLAQLEPPTPQYRFFPSRRWRIDFAWPGAKLAVEIESGVHCIATRFESDREKYNVLAEHGWDLLRFTLEDLRRDPDRCLALVRAKLNP